MKEIIMKAKTKSVVTVETSLMESDLRPLIHEIRGVPVMLDRDLAMLYQVDIAQLNRQVKRNIDRFPIDFMFQLAKSEMENLKCQFGISSWGGDRYLPYAFTENGIAMLSGVLRSKTAIEANIQIMRAFVAMRRALQSMAPLTARIDAVEMRQMKLVEAQAKNEERFEKIFDAMNDKKFPPQKVFFDGEFFDAFVQMKRFVRQAKSSLIVIDPYFDDSGLALLAQKREGVKITVVISPRGRRNLHDLDVDKFNKQYNDSLNIFETDKFHDRYLIIDNSTLIHIGASLNYLGKKCFAFSTLGPEIIPAILERLPLICV